MMSQDASNRPQKTTGPSKIMSQIGLGARSALILGSQSQTPRDMNAARCVDSRLGEDGRVRFRLKTNQSQPNMDGLANQSKRFLPPDAKHTRKARSATHTHIWPCHDKSKGERQTKQTMLGTLPTPSHVLLFYIPDGVRPFPKLRSHVKSNLLVLCLLNSRRKAGRDDDAVPSAVPLAVPWAVSLSPSSRASCASSSTSSSGLTAAKSAGIAVAKGSFGSITGCRAVTSSSPKCSADRAKSEGVGKESVLIASAYAHSIASPNAIVLMVPSML